MTIRELRNLRWGLITGVFAGFYFGIVMIQTGVHVLWWVPLTWIAAWGIVEFGLYYLDRRLEKRLKQQYNIHDIKK